MADELRQYCFVAAVFRESGDLASTIAELRSNGIAGNRLLVVANHRAEDARKATAGSEIGPAPVIAVHGDGAIKLDASIKLSPELHTLLQAMGDDGAGGADGAGRSQVYAQLRRDAADGALVLIASVADPDEQLLGARILLRGNCECVLTHEIAA